MKYRHSPAGTRGQALIEFAVALMTFFTLLFGIIQAGFYWNARTMVKYAAYVAARTALVTWEEGQDNEEACLRDIHLRAFLAIIPVAVPGLDIEEEIKVKVENTLKELLEEMTGDNDNFLIRQIVENISLPPSSITTSVNPFYPSVRERLERILSAYLLTKIEISGVEGSNEYIRARVTYPYRLIFPFIRSALGGSISIVEEVELKSLEPIKDLPAASSPEPYCPGKVIGIL